MWNWGQITAPDTRLHRIEMKIWQNSRVKITANVWANNQAGDIIGEFVWDVNTRSGIGKSFRIPPIIIVCKKCQAVVRSWSCISLKIIEAILVSVSRQAICRLTGAKRQAARRTVMKDNDDFMVSMSSSKVQEVRSVTQRTTASEMGWLWAYGGLFIHEAGGTSTSTNLWAQIIMWSVSFDRWRTWLLMEPDTYIWNENNIDIISCKHQKMVHVGHWFLLAELATAGMCKSCTIAAACIRTEL